MSLTTGTQVSFKPMPVADAHIILLPDETLDDTGMTELPPALALFAQKACFDVILTALLGSL